MFRTLDFELHWSPKALKTSFSLVSMTKLFWTGLHKLEVQFGSIENSLPIFNFPRPAERMIERL